MVLAPGPVELTGGVSRDMIHILNLFKMIDGKDEFAMVCSGHLFCIKIAVQSSGQLTECKDWAIQSNVAFRT